MKSIFRRWCRRVLSTLFLMTLACTFGPGAGDGDTIEPNESSSIGGTGSEVVGVVNYPDSNGSAKIRAGVAAKALPLVNGGVFINPLDYLADTGHANETLITSTESDGSFKISNVVPGTHILYIRDNSGNAVAKKFTVHQNQARVDIGTLVAVKTAGVSMAYSGPAPGELLFFIDVLGTGLQLRCTGGALQFTLDRIPCGADYGIVVRMYKPIKKGYQVSTVNPVPGITTTLQSITGE